jgi:sarcosine oxidase
MRYDVVVVGLGAMGSAILAHSARRGAHVLGLEQFTAAHDLGSSHGKSRMIRKAYFEDPAYVPLLVRSYDLWREFEELTGQKVLTITGLLMVGHRSASVVTGAKYAAHQHDLPLQALTAPEIRARYPMLRVRDDEIGVFEPDGGVLDPELCVRVHLEAAKAAGAEMQFGVAMEGWDATADGFFIRLVGGTEVTSRSLVLSLGSWFKSELEDLGVPIQVQRNVQGWFTPTGDQYSAGGFPCFLLERDSLPSPLYGFPDFGDGVKLAFHGHGDFTDAEHLVREVDFERDVHPIARATEDWMPGATASLRGASACPYTITPDGHFIVDRHPKHPRLILCGGFSGHGFKFAPVIGEICADLALEENSRHDIKFLSLQRFARSRGGHKAS